MLTSKIKEDIASDNVVALNLAFSNPGRISLEYIFRLAHICIDENAKACFSYLCPYIKDKLSISATYLQSLLTNCVVLKREVIFQMLIDEFDAKLFFPSYRFCLRYLIQIGDRYKFINYIVDKFRKDSSYSLDSLLDAACAFKETAVAVRLLKSGAMPTNNSVSSVILTKNNLLFSLLFVIYGFEIDNLIDPAFLRKHGTVFMCKTAYICSKTPANLFLTEPYLGEPLSSIRWKRAKHFFLGASNRARFLFKSDDRVLFDLYRFPIDTFDQLASDDLEMCNLSQVPLSQLPTWRTIKIGAYAFDILDLKKLLDEKPDPKNPYTNLIFSIDELDMIWTRLDIIAKHFHHSAIESFVEESYEKIEAPIIDNTAEERFQLLVDEVKAIYSYYTFPPNIEKAISTQENMIGVFFILSDELKTNPVFFSARHLIYTSTTTDSPLEAIKAGFLKMLYNIIHENKKEKESRMMVIKEIIDIVLSSEEVNIV